MSFVHSSELVCFGPWSRHVLLQLENEFELGGIAIVFDTPHRKCLPASQVDGLVVLTGFMGVW